MTTSILNRILLSKAGAAALILRVPVGLILAAHGAQSYLAGLAVTVWQALRSG